MNKEIKKEKKKKKIGKRKSKNEEETTNDKRDGNCSLHKHRKMRMGIEQI